jgi:phage-related minor tail protein
MSLQIKDLEIEKAELKKELELFEISDVANLDFRSDVKSEISTRIDDLEKELDTVRLELKTDALNKELIAKKETLKSDLNELKKAAKA